MSKEAMKLALEALEYIYEGANNQGPHTGISWRCVSKKAAPAITALRKALAEQPAQQDSTCSNALRAQGKAYPRTCKKCGFGPCIELAQQALDKKAENARALGLDYEPARTLEELCALSREVSAEQPAQHEPTVKESLMVDAYCKAWEQSFTADNPYHTVKMTAEDRKHIAAGLKAALADHTEQPLEMVEQPAQQEPVAYLVDGDLYYPEEIDWESLQEQGHTVASLYTQAQRTWVGLSDAQNTVIWANSQSVDEAIRATEKQLMENNI